MPVDQLQKLFFLYRDSPRRREAINNTFQSLGDNYLLYGLQEYRDQGYIIRHNLETARRSSRFVHIFSWLINKGLGFYGGIGGDFRSVIACRKMMNKSDIILSTVDTVGIPLALFNAKNFISRPVVYTSIGFPERIARFRNEKAVEKYCNIFSNLDAIIGYGYEEFRLLKAWLSNGDGDASVHFVPFGVDTDYFSPGKKRVDPEVDILSVGADSYRDFSLLLSLARAYPEYRIEIITSREHRERLGEQPGNVQIVCDIPLEQMKSRLDASRVVVLPIIENSYSGATTTLLQAMAMEKPVIVSRVGAIKAGYFLKDGNNCLFVEPGDERGLIQKTVLLMNDLQLQKKLSFNARVTVQQNLTWAHYVNKMLTILTDTQKEYRGRKKQS